MVEVFVWLFEGEGVDALEALPLDLNLFVVHEVGVDAACALRDDSTRVVRQVLVEPQCQSGLVLRLIALDQAAVV